MRAAYAEAVHQRMAALLQIPTVAAAPKQASVVKAGKVFVVKKIRYRVIKVNGRRGSLTVKGVKGTVKKLVIPKKVIYKGIRFDVVAIADRAFYKNRKIRRALIGTNIKSIGKMAFYGTRQLRSEEHTSELQSLV